MSDGILGIKSNTSQYNKRTQITTKLDSSKQVTTNRITANRFTSSSKAWTTTSATPETGTAVTTTPSRRCRQACRTTTTKAGAQPAIAYRRHLLGEKETFFVQQNYADWTTKLLPNIFWREREANRRIGQLRRSDTSFFVSRFLLFYPKLN